MGAAWERHTMCELAFKAYWQFALVCISTAPCYVASRSHALELSVNVDDLMSANIAMYPEPWSGVCRHEDSSSKKFSLRSTALGYFNPVN